MRLPAGLLLWLTSWMVWNSPPDAAAAMAPAAPRVRIAAVEGAFPRHAGPRAPATIDTIPGTAWTQDDWSIFDAAVRRAAAARVDTLPIGAAIVLVGRSFVGSPYVPGTLEAPGAEHLIVNLRSFDCVTFVESMLALVHFARRDGAAALAHPATARARFEQYLRELRYRNGRLDGYVSRLHYFSEWLGDHERRGLLRVLGDEIGGGVDSRPIAFMTAHASAYRQLSDSGLEREIARIERALPARRVVPKADLLRVEPLLQDGDVLAMTSALAGLDVAHVGFAVFVDGRPHLLNAPLAGQSVELSPLPLMDHLAARSKQTGVIVGRMQERW